MERAVYLKCLNGALPPLTFLLILWFLFEPKSTRRTAVCAAAGFVAAELAVQAAVLALGDGLDLALTLLPLTLYLPAVVCLHLLSKRPFLPTALVWLLALLCDRLLAALRKLLALFAGPFGGPDWLFAAVLPAAAAGLLLTLILRFLRAPFRSCAAELEGSWPYFLFLPLMLLALYSYFLSSVTDVTVFILLFLTALAAFLVLARLLVSLAGERGARETRLQLKALRQDYEVLQKKLELGRGYRHDMRHHMTALSALLQAGDCAGAQRYISGWQGQLTRIETERWCGNAAVNGVLSAYLEQARASGCTPEVEVSLPLELPVDEVDLCVILANALENAIHACEHQPEGMPRRILLSVSLTGRRLAIQLVNSCHQSVAVDSKGFPIVPRRKGHGQGLRSIAALAEKHHGLFQCEWEDGHFTLRVVLLDAEPAARRVRRLPAACAGMFLFLFLLNCMPALAQALERVPVLGRIVQVVDLRSYSLRWGDTVISIQEPVLEGDGSAADALNARKEEYIARMEETFLWYVSRKYQGYVAEDVAYDIVRDDEALFILRFTATLNAGGSSDCSRYLILDKNAGEVLELAALFQPEVNYIFPISREIQAQMAEQINAGEADYFLPGGIWPDEDCFKSIDPDQEFYINEDGQLVIVFEEYEVAPGSMGAPEFVIPTDVLDGLLARPSHLR